MTYTVSLGDPLLVEIIDHSEWWQPWLPFAGSTLLFLGAMYTLWRTNGATDCRHAEQLSAIRAEGAAGRAAERVDKFREEVSGILAERWPLADAINILAEATVQYRKDFSDPDISPQRAVDTFNEVLSQQRTHLNRFIDLAIRASLLTNDAEILDILRQTRETARNGWNEVKTSTTRQFSDAFDVEREREWRSAFHGKLVELETATRALATTDGVPSPVAVAQPGRRHWYLLWLR
jgi:hypothetical protein